MRRWICAAALLALAWTAPAAAEPPAAAYCGDGLLAERFDTQVEPPPRGLVHYAVVLRNAAAEERRFVLVVTATLFERPSSALRTIAAGERLTISLGHQAWQPGVAPLRGDQLAQATRISCR